MLLPLVTLLDHCIAMIGTWTCEETGDSELARINSSVNGYCFYTFEIGR